MVVKFCGINKVEYAKMAIELGADYLGFLVGITHVAEDKLTNEEAKKIIEESDFRNSIPIAVTHLQVAKEIITTMREIGVNAVQIHDSITVDGIKEIRDAFPNGYIIKAVHVENKKRSLDMALMFEEHVDALLLDSRTSDRLGGTGKIHDWNISREIVSSVRKHVFLAGGLTPDNVVQAIYKVKPYGVDVNSGVEVDGAKDLTKMTKFIRLAKGE